MHAASRFILTLVLCTLCAAWAQQGRLEQGDGQLESGEYYDLHEHEGTAGGRLTVSLASDDFDPYLIVLAPDGTELLQVDDTPGRGFGVEVELELPVSGSYVFVVTSAYAAETGAYTLNVSGAAHAEPTPGVNPLGPRADGNPLARQQAAGPITPPVPTSPFSGTFVGDGLELRLSVSGTGASGTLIVAGASYDVAGSIAGDTFSGTFGDASQRFELSATLQAATAAGRGLLVESGGASYLLTRTDGPAEAPGGPAAPARAPAPATATAPTQPAPVLSGPVVAPGARSDAPRPQGTPVPGIEPRAGFVTGTVFDTQGRPLAGAGVLITGTTYVQGQRTSFEAVTGPDGTYAVRVPDGRYGARAWIDVQFQGVTYSRILHPLSGNLNTEIDSEVGGSIDFQWLLSGLIAPPGDDPSDYYGASIDLSYCGLPADAYCAADYAAFPDRRIAPGGSTVLVTLTPVGPLIDGSQGEVMNFRFVVAPQDPEYPYGGAPNAPTGFEDGGAGRLVLGADWEYHSAYLHDIPLGVYDLGAVAILPDGSSQSLLVGLADDDVEHTSVRVSFAPWDDFSGRSYWAGGLNELDVYIRD